MAYISLETLKLPTDFRAKDITIINYNATLKKIEGYVNQVQNNTQYLKDHVGSALYVSPTEPTNTEVDIWVKIED